MKTSIYAQYRFHPDVIKRAVWMYFRFNLSFRDVEELMIERGVDLSYETIRRWVDEFGSTYAKRIKSRILEDMRFAHLDGSIGKLRRSFARPNLLIIDDFGISPIEQRSKEDLFEVLEDRTDVSSTLIAGQLSPSEWHHFLNSEHLADAIMDRMVQRAHTIDLSGDSLRERIKDPLMKA